MQPKVRDASHLPHFLHHGVRVVHEAPTKEGKAGAGAKKEAGKKEPEAKAKAKEKKASPEKKPASKKPSASKAAE